jgi:hypothetical protein
MMNIDLNSINPANILFLDIETVPQRASFAELADDERALWEHKAQSLLQRDDSDKTAADIYGRAGIYAEFGRIVCISAGFLVNQQDDDGQAVKRLRVKSFAGDDERALLDDFALNLNKLCSMKNNKLWLCGHNSKEFDCPYIIRRMLITGVSLPPILRVFGLRPWETPFLDTMELWKFGDYKNFTSLALLAHIFGIPTPKDDINGSDVARVYYEERDISRIARYCEKDVLTVARLFMRFKGEAAELEMIEHAAIIDEFNS